MKKVVSIFAVVVMSVGLFSSCESETNVADDDALYNVEVQATDRAYNKTTERE